MHAALRLALPRAAGRVAPRVRKSTGLRHGGLARVLSYFRVGVDDPAPSLPVFDGKRVLEGSAKARLDQVLHEHGVCVLGRSRTSSSPFVPALDPLLLAISSHSSLLD